MLSVGIKELKTRLSSYIDSVEQGEEVVVTERGREVALIIPITPERRALAGLVREGRARYGSGKPRGVSGIELIGKPLSETVLEERQ
ncbi:MAG TPA: type II toxin-antitoxin system prevent-host-death family antitoxin [Desulfuromonadales bacterium]|nr:type II toxin-antitoxin system prevent-host-death family antitoxin [Desulfuromonadales bacterium]